MIVPHEATGATQPLDIPHYDLVTDSFIIDLGRLVAVVWLILALAIAWRLSVYGPPAMLASVAVLAAWRRG